MTTEDNTTKPLGQVHSLTCRMGDLSRMIMNLHPESPSRLSCITEYKSSKAKAKAIRDTITDIEDRKTATWFIRTAAKPVDSTGKAIA
jgi:hypothetical protein